MSLAAQRAFAQPGDPEKVSALNEVMHQVTSQIYKLALGDNAPRHNPLEFPRADAEFLPFLIGLAERKKIGEDVLWCLQRITERSLLKQE